MVNASRSSLFLALVALAAAVGCGRLHEHPLVVEATEEVRLNPRVADTLGAPPTRPTASPTSSSKPRARRPRARSSSRARRPAGSGA